MLECGACEPGSLGGFDERTAAGCDVLMAAAFEGMVGRPAPHVVDVA